MAALFWGSAIVLLAFVLHVVWWRWSVPRYQTKALLLLFFGTLAVVLGCLALMGQEMPFPRPVDAADRFQIALFVLACTLGYVITWSAVEADSPTLVMVKAIASAGSAGLSEQEFQASVSDEILILPRLADLVRDGMLIQEDGRFRLTSKGRRFVRIFILFRRVLGAGKGG